MTREEALKLVRENYPHFGTTEPWLDLEKALATLIPELAESEDERIRKIITDSVFYQYGAGVEYEDVLDYLDKLENQKENPKSADSIPSDCTSDAKCENRWHKVADSLPDNGRLVLAKDCLGNVLLARYDGENWEVNVYDNEDHYCHNSISKWCEIPSEKQKDQKSIIQDVELNDAVYDYVRDHFIAGADFTPEYIKKLMENAFFAWVDYYLLEQKPADWSEEEKAIIHGCINRICVPDKYIDHSNDARSIAFLESLLNGQRIREGCMGIKGPSCDPGRRGRMGGVPKEISKEAEASQAKFPGPYNEDDIITAYETAKMKAIEDLPKWKEAKAYGKGECTIGSAFEATGRRYPILYCYGYGISIEQLFEKLPKKED